MVIYLDFLCKLIKLWNDKPVPFKYKIPNPNVCLVKTKPHIVPQETTDTERRLSLAAFVSQASTSFHFIHYCLMEIIDFFFFANEKHL